MQASCSLMIDLYDAVNDSTLVLAQYLYGTIEHAGRAMQLCEPVCITIEYCYLYSRDDGIGRYKYLYKYCLYHQHASP
jgi:hypothetical protein